MTPQVPGPAQKLNTDTKITTRSPADVEPLAGTQVRNTKNLALRLASDLVSGLSAAAMVAPVITVIDKSVPLFTPKNTANSPQGNYAKCFRARNTQKLPKNLHYKLPAPTAQPRFLQTIRSYLHALWRYLSHCQHC